MLNDLYKVITENTGSDVPVIIISLAIMLASGFLLTRVTKKLKLPNVTAYIVAGILIGPFALNLVPQTVVDGMGFLPDIALAFIAFGVGEFFRVSTLRKSGAKVIIITLFEALTASLLIFIVTFFVLRLPLAFAIVLAALASATAPASTMMTIRQTKAKGEFVDTLLQVVALDDVVSLLAYSVAISIAIASTVGSFSFSAVGMPILLNILAIGIGVLFGFGLKFLISSKRTTDNRLIIILAVLFLFCGICAALGVSPLLGCMVIGTVYINATGDEKLFKQVNYFSPPILLLFFVRSGVSFDLKALVSVSGSAGIAPLWLVGVIYFIVRIIGKYAGAFAGGAVTKKPKEVRNFLGLALVPQAGVAIGLAALGARTIGGEMGNSLQTIILASSVLYELIGPALAKLALFLSHSYSDKIEDVAAVEQTTEAGEQKSEVDILIERINKIRTEIEPQDSVDENEKAFNEAAEEYETYILPRPGLKNRK